MQYVLRKRIPLHRSRMQLLTKSDALPKSICYVFCDKLISKFKVWSEKRTFAIGQCPRSRIYGQYGGYRLKTLREKFLLASCHETISYISYLTLTKSVEFGRAIHVDSFFALYDGKFGTGLKNGRIWSRFRGKSEGKRSLDPSFCFRKLHPYLIATLDIITHNRCRSWLDVLSWFENKSTDVIYRQIKPPPLSGNPCRRCFEFSVSV